MVDIYVVDVQYGGETLDGVYSVYAQIFGRRSTGESVCVKVRGLRPYFYCLAPDATQCSPETAARAIVGPLANYLHEHGEGLKDRGGWNIRRGEQLATVTVEAESVLRTPVMRYQGECAMLRISCSHPCAVPVLRDAIIGEKIGWHIGKDVRVRPGADAFEANLDFVLRFMVDNDVRCNAWIHIADPIEDGSHMACSSQDIICSSPRELRAYTDEEEEDKGLVPSLTVLSFDIECTAEKGLFPDPLVDTNAVIQIACDTVKVDGRKVEEVEDDATSVLFALGATDPDVVGRDVDVRCFNDEKEMLLAFAQFVREEADPDVITSWNGPNFDWKYIVSRCEHLGIEDQGTRFSRIPYYKTRNREATKATKAFGTTKDNEVMMPGRTIFDLFTPVRKNYKLRSYKLGDVAEKFLGKCKDDVKPSEIAELWEGTDADRGKLGHYWSVFLPPPLSLPSLSFPLSSTFFACGALLHPRC